MAVISRRGRKPETAGARVAAAAAVAAASAIGSRLPEEHFFSGGNQRQHPMNMVNHFAGRLTDTSFAESAVGWSATPGSTAMRDLIPPTPVRSSDQTTPIVSSQFLSASALSGSSHSSRWPASATVEEAVQHFRCDAVAIMQSFHLQSTAENFPARRTVPLLHLKPLQPSCSVDSSARSSYAYVSHVPSPTSTSQVRVASPSSGRIPSSRIAYASEICTSARSGFHEKNNEFDLRVNTGGLCQENGMSLHHFAHTETEIHARKAAGFDEIPSLPPLGNFGFGTNKLEVESIDKKSSRFPWTGIDSQGESATIVQQGISISTHFPGQDGTKVVDIRTSQDKLAERPDVYVNNSESNPDKMHQFDHTIPTSNSSAMQEQSGKTRNGSVLRDALAPVTSDSCLEGGSQETAPHRGFHAESEIVNEVVPVAGFDEMQWPQPDLSSFEVSSNKAHGFNNNADADWPQMACLDEKPSSKRDLGSFEAKKDKGSGFEINGFGADWPEVADLGCPEVNRNTISSFDNVGGTDWPRVPGFDQLASSQPSLGSEAMTNIVSGFGKDANADWPQASMNTMSSFDNVVDTGWPQVPCFDQIPSSQPNLGREAITKMASGFDKGANGDWPQAAVFKEQPPSQPNLGSFKVSNEVRCFSNGSDTVWPRDTVEISSSQPDAASFEGSVNDRSAEINGSGFDHILSSQHDRRIAEISQAMPPVATIGLDTNLDGKTDLYVTGVDRNSDGIPDILQNPQVAGGSRVGGIRLSKRLIQSSHYQFDEESQPYSIPASPQRVVTADVSSIRSTPSRPIDDTVDEVTRHLLCARSKIEAVEHEFAQIMNELSAYSERVPSVESTSELPEVSPPPTVAVNLNGFNRSHAEYFSIGTPLQRHDDFGNISSNSTTGRQLIESMGE